MWAAISQMIGGIIQPIWNYVRFDIFPKSTGKQPTVEAQAIILFLNTLFNVYFYFITKKFANQRIQKC